MNKYWKTILIIAFCLGFLLRTIRLRDVPLSLNRDEVGLGYDAYSLLKTGKDQFGKFMPLTLRSSDDYKPALYSYLSIPFIASFGLNSLSIRLPSAILGSLSILFTALLVLELLRVYHTRTNQYSLSHNTILVIALLASLFLAISPWHIQFSRGAFEANASLFFILGGVVFLFRSLISARNAFFSGIFLGLAILTYHSARFLSPALLITFIIIYEKYWQFKTKTVLLLIVTFSFFFILALPALVSKDAQIRFRVLSLFNNQKFEEQSAKDLLIDQKLGDTILGRIIHNRRSSSLRYDVFIQVVQNYLLHLDPNNIIFGSNSPSLQSHHTPQVGVLYVWEAIFGIIGFFFLIKSVNKRTFLLFIWFILGFLPAAITWDIPSYLRSILVLPTVQIFAATGMVIFFRWIIIQSKLLSILSLFFLNAVILFSILVFIHQYFFHLNYETAEDWRFGRKEAAIASYKIKDNYNKIIVSTSLDDPHLFFLFHLKYDPKTYLAQGGTIRGGWTATENHFDKYEFRSLSRLNSNKEKILYIGLAKEVPMSAMVIKTIYYPDGKEAIKLYEL